jgi:hypothetical protein
MCLKCCFSTIKAFNCLNCCAAGAVAAVTDDVVVTAVAAVTDDFVVTAVVVVTLLSVEDVIFSAI